MKPTNDTSDTVFATLYELVPAYVAGDAELSEGDALAIYLMNYKGENDDPILDIYNIIKESGIKHRSNDKDWLNMLGERESIVIVPLDANGDELIIALSECSEIYVQLYRDGDFVIDNICSTIEGIEDIISV